MPTAKRIILYLGESNQDLGIFAYRTIGRISLSAGSVIDFVNAAKAQGDDVAVVVANLGQLLWNRKFGRAMTLKSWDALPRKGGMGMPTRIEAWNRVKGHEGIAEHVTSVFEWIKGQMHEQAKVEVVGVCEGWEQGMQYLSEEKVWKKWKGRLGGIAFGTGYSRGADKDIFGDGLREFVVKVGCHALRALGGKALANHQTAWSRVHHPRGTAGNSAAGHQHFRLGGVGLHRVYHPASLPGHAGFPRAGGHRAWI